MKRTVEARGSARAQGNHSFSLLALVLCLDAATAACTPAGEVAELGVYHREGSPDTPDASGEDAGAPSGEISQPCPVPMTDGGTGGVGDTAFGPGLPPCLSDGCIAKNGPSYSDPDLRCFFVRAHAADAPATPYTIPAEPDHYVKFTLQNPETGARFIRSIQPVIDNPRFLHHMKLYAHQGVFPEGVAAGGARASGLRLVYGWAPGAKSLFLDESVGMSMEPDTFYTLEVHYNYQAEFGYGLNADASGIQLCVTSSQPSFAVSLSRLGSDSFMGSSAHGTCTPSNSQPIQLLAVQRNPSATGVFRLG